MYKKLNKIWVTALTLIALMLSSVTSAAHVMPLQTDFGHQLVAVSDKHESHCDSVKVTVQQETQECCESDGMLSEHQCCPSSCVASYTAITGATSSYHQPYSLVLITKESSMHASAIANALFRPPIA